MNNINILPSKKHFTPNAWASAVQVLAVETTAREIISEWDEASKDPLVFEQDDLLKSLVWTKILRRAGVSLQLQQAQNKLRHADAELTARLEEIIETAKTMIRDRPNLRKAFDTENPGYVEGKRLSTLSRLFAMDSEDTVARDVYGLEGEDNSVDHGKVAMYQGEDPSKWSRDTTFGGSLADNIVQSRTGYIDRESVDPGLNDPERETPLDPLDDLL